MNTKETFESINDKGINRFFRKLDWSAFWTAFLISFAVYCYTLAPTVTLEDSGELAVAGDYLGVPHPPGYPIWSITAWMFTKIFSFVSFRGQPNPAWSIGLLSAFFGAMATALTAMLICRSGSDILKHSKQISTNIDQSTDDIICWVGGVVCSLLFAFSPVMWSQSVIVEVYSLNAFFLILIFLFVYMWICNPASNKLLYITAFVFGLGLTNYQVLLLAALALVVAMMLKDIELFRDFSILVAPFILTVFLIKKGVLPEISHPTHISCFIYLFLNFLVISLAWFFLPKGKTVAITLLLAELGVAFYAYMPIVSDFRNPPMNWGYPRTWEGFKHAITRGQYERINPSDVFSPLFIDQIGAYLTDLRGQFTLPIALLGFLPFTAWQIKIRGYRIKALYVAIALSILASIIVVIEKFLFPAGSISAIRTDKLLTFGIILILSVGGMALFIGQADEFIQKLKGSIKASISEKIIITLILIASVAIFLFYIIMLAGKIIDITSPLNNVRGSINKTQIKYITDILMMIIIPSIFIGFVIWMIKGNAKLEITIDKDSQKWIIATLFGFLAMSVVLIALANLKLEIQDMFIQRVKFISSHALFAFWIGYGLIFGLAFVDILFKGNKTIKWLSLGVAVMLPLIPIHQNACNKELIRKFGGAEQNGHDFGWQFGNYQLRGAQAIIEELDPEEEPLPNPSFPPEMGQDAIFYGGTDPGRFVPTYMIYSARVREDVYLITQNALADNTYMSVMRDLYGDKIWIPSPPDSAQAFQIYVKEVRAGKRPNNANLKIENGRVQVSGALGVMEINGILAKMIFDYNNYKHPFYVEESYVIRWMYPYLTPHGLIMKINKNQTPISNELINDDMDFWNWYSKKLTTNKKFIRDIVAKKSFSKLRSAIGGLYANKGRLYEAEQAFQEARMLYSLSPEANFRLVQEVYMRQGRFDKAKRIIKEFSKQDPNNRKAVDFLKQVNNIEKMIQQIHSMENKMSSGRLDINNALKLSDLYIKAGQIPKFMNLSTSILNATNLPPVFYFQLAQMFNKVHKPEEITKALDKCIYKIPNNVPAEIFLDIIKMYGAAGKPEKMKIAMTQYLKRKPNDWKAWLDMATLQIKTGSRNAAIRSLELAIKYGNNEARSLINSNQIFAPIRNKIRSHPPEKSFGFPGISGFPANRLRKEFIR